ncbi:MFS transporter [Bordetella bronchialis]|uniref:MFS transporter n=1 Tax=Bordetella bronchialis TaxID=463025 RepID=UPI003D06A06E
MNSLSSGAGRPVTQPPLTRGLLFALAVTAGAAVANLYYSQPMLALIAATFHAGEGIGLITMCTQLGYTVGLVLLVPLGDRLERRRLILAQCVLLIAAAVACAIAPSFNSLIAASILLGVGATITQLIIPFAADLAPDTTRGQAVGVVFSGLLAGILLARTLSGAIGQLLGWRAMFWVAAGIALALGAMMFMMLPRVAPKSRLPYARLLGSMVQLPFTHAPLRRACATQACLFGLFSAFWSVLALMLAEPPYRMGSAVAGAFGIVGLIGVGAASWGGKLADRYGARNGVGAGIVACAVSFVVFALAPSMAGLVVGVILLDLGVSLAQVSNQSLILSLDAQARSRINTVYVTAIFFGGAFGSGAASVAWHRGGWQAVSMLGLGLALAALAIHIHDRISTKRLRASRATP